MPWAPTEQEAPRLTEVMVAQWLPRHAPWLLPVRSHAVHHGAMLQGQALLHQEGRTSIHLRHPRYCLAVPDKSIRVRPHAHQGWESWGRCAAAQHTFQGHHLYFVAIISAGGSVLIRRALGRINCKGACGNGNFLILLGYKGLSRQHGRGVHCKARRSSKHMGPRSSSVAFPQVAAGDHMGSDTGGEGHSSSWR